MSARLLGLGFSNPEPGGYGLEYDIVGDERRIYQMIPAGGAAVFLIAEDVTKTETYTPRQRSGGEVVIDPINGRLTVTAGAMKGRHLMAQAIG